MPIQLKVMFSLMIVSLFINIIAFPGSKIAEFGEYIFGGYSRFLIAIMMIWIIPSSIIGILWIWSL
jgi:hypothetical protein